MIWHFFQWEHILQSLCLCAGLGSTFFHLQNCIFYLDESKINGVWPKIYLVTDVESTPLKVGRDCHQPVFRKQCLPCQSHYWPKFKSANCYVLSVFLKTALLGALDDKLKKYSMTFIFDVAQNKEQVLVFIDWHFLKDTFFSCTNTMRHDKQISISFSF